MFKPLLRNARSVAVLLVAGLVLAACSSAASPKDKIKVQLGWIHEYSSAHLYAAEKNGHFARENLEVNLIEGGFSGGTYIEPIAAVVKGEADFAMAGAADLLIARTAGKPVVGIAAILQRGPLAIITLAKSNIRRPQDLIGKKIAASEGGATFVYNSLLTSQQIDSSQVTTIPRTTYGIDPLLNGEVDGLVGWIINEGVLVREAGQEPNFILMGDYGIDTYEIVIFSSEKMVKERPELVARFVKAVTLGIKDVINSPDEAIKYTLDYGKDLNKEAQLRRLQASLPLLNPAGSKPGIMQEAIWKNTYQMLLDNKVLDKPLDFHSAYTMQFLDKVYAQ